MPAKDLHKKPFGEFTLTKLAIFEKYTEAWLPTFISQGIPKIFIFDFFAGPGYDKNGVPGSPIRTLQIVNKFLKLLESRNVRVEIFLNEYSKSKFEALNYACDSFLQENSELACFVTCHYYRKDFGQLFDLLLPKIKEAPSLVFLDQNGVKFTSIRYFEDLGNTSQTDFLYFVSSSYFLRFGNTDEFKKHLNLDIEAAKKSPYKLIHNNLVDHIRRSIKNSNIKLLPYSLKKGGNIHGLIFGTKSYKGIDKFLSVAWDISPLNGTANFDIEEDAPSAQLNLFNPPKLSKIDKFNLLLEEAIKQKKVVDSQTVYRFTLDHAHPPKHATSHLKVLKKNDKVFFDSISPKIAYKALKDRDANIDIIWVGKN